MNKALSLFCVSFVLVLLMATTFAIAEEARLVEKKEVEETGQVGELKETEAVNDVEIQKYEDDTETDNEINANVKAPAAKIVSIWQGFVISEDKTKAEVIRAVITSQRFNKLLAAVDEQTIEQIKQIKATETPEVATQKIKELLQQKVSNVAPENGVVAGLLIIGKGKDHETYRLIAKEITPEKATFDVYSLGAIKVTAEMKRGLLIGIRRALGLAKPEETTTVTEEVDTEQLKPIGTLEVTRNKYEHIEIDTGKLSLTETPYEGNWDVTAYSIHKLPVYKLAKTA